MRMHTLGQSTRIYIEKEIRSISSTPNLIVPTLTRYQQESSPEHTAIAREMSKKRHLKEL